MKTEFIRPKLVGDRFAEHSIPLEVLKDWIAFEALINDAARFLYKQENPERRRSPRGFDKGFSLHISQVTDGSAVLELDQFNIPGTLLPDEHAVWFVRARDFVLDAIAAIAAGADVAGALPQHLVSYFDRFGRSLRDDEHIELPRVGTASVRYDPAIRKRIVLSQATEYRTEETLRGSIYEVNTKTATFQLELPSTHRIQAGYDEDHFPAVIAAVGQVKTSLAVVSGIVVRGTDDAIKRIENVSAVELLDPLDVATRLLQIAALPEGWLEPGVGPAIDKAGLQWLAKAWEQNWPADAPLPLLFPTPSGEIEAEWSGAHALITVAINLAERRAHMVRVILDGEIEEEDVYDLHIPESWAEFSRVVRELVPEGAGDGR